MVLKRFCDLCDAEIPDDTTQIEVLDNRFDACSSCVLMAREWGRLLRKSVREDLRDYIQTCKREDHKGA